MVDNVTYRNTDEKMETADVGLKPESQDELGSSYDDDIRDISLDDDSKYAPTIDELIQVLDDDEMR